MNSFPGRGVTDSQSRFVWVIRCEQQEQLRLQRIGVLELVHEDPPESRLEMAANAGVVPNEIARPQQQIEEIQCALSCFQPLVVVNAAEEFGVQCRSEIGVGPHLEVGKRLHQRLAGRQYAGPAHPLRIGRPAALARALEIPVAPELNQQRLDPVQVAFGGRTPFVGRLNPLSRSRRAGLTFSGAQLAAQSANGFCIHEQVVAGIGGVGRLVRACVDEINRARNRCGAVKRLPRPGAPEVPPLRQIPTRAPQPLDRAVLIGVAGVEAAAASSQRTPHTLRRVLEPRLKPGWQTPR